MKRYRPSSHDCPVPACPSTRLHWEAVCRSCWTRLPEDLRGPIQSARAAKARHREGAAVIVAVQWLVDHPIAAMIATQLGERVERGSL